MEPGTESAKAAFRYFGGFAALFILLSEQAFAQQVPPANEKPVLSVNYLEEEAGFLVFSVAVSKPSGKKAILKVSGINADLLYSEIISGDSYTKILKFSRYETNAIEFLVVSGKEIIRKSFKIKSETREPPAEISGLTEEK